MVVIGELPLSFVECAAMKHFCNKVNLYKPHSRRTTGRDIVKIFVERKATLKKWFLTTKQRVSLTTDIWVSSVTGSSYMVITAHYIDKNWRIKKLIIGFKHVEDRKSKTIANTLLKCLAEWGIERLFTITVDNATANTSALSQFQFAFSLVSEDSLVLGGDFMHMRCARHIINLIVKDGLTEIDSSVTAIRNGISYVRGGPNRRKSFQLRVDSSKFSTGSLPLDVCTRWNSTFLMLNRASKFKGAFDRMEFEDKLYYDHFLETENGVKRIGPPQRDDWRKVERLVKFLQVFYHATLVVSTSTTMNAYKCYGEIVNIAFKLQLLCHSSDNDVKVNAQKMFDKFDKYWDGMKNINKMLVLVSVFDPRKKMQYANLCFEELYREKSITATSLYDSVLSILHDMYKEYSTRYDAGANEELFHSQSSTQSTQDRQTDRIFDSMEDEFDGYNPVDHKYDTLLRKIGVRNTNELDTYLREEVENPELMMGIEYDVLFWWKVNSGKYPILSQMARDLFAMQVSSVASESAFSTSGRIINPYRSCLTHYMVEILMCTEQWFKQDLKFEDIVLTNAQILAEFEFEDGLEREFESDSDGP